MESHPGDTLGTRFLTFWGAVLAFFGFALFAMLLQKCSSGVAEDPRNSVRVANLVEIDDAGNAQLEKWGWGADNAEAMKAAVALVKERKQAETKAVVPGTETAKKMAAEAAAAAAPPAGEGDDETNGESSEGGEETAPENTDGEAATPGPEEPNES